MGALFISQLTMPAIMPPPEAGCPWMAMDLDGCGRAISELDFEQILAFLSPPRTFLDALERYWMVGRVATTPTAQTIDL
jgi:hypothetical protein